jgi:hypothetical protein
MTTSPARWHQMFSALASPSPGDPHTGRHCTIEIIGNRGSSTDHRLTMGFLIAIHGGLRRRPGGSAAEGWRGLIDLIVDLMADRMTRGRSRADKTFTRRPGNPRSRAAAARALRDAIGWEPYMSDEPTAPKLQVQIDEDVAQGVYSNLVLLNHTENEFVLDFAFIQPSNGRAKVRSRVISSPRHTKRLLQALQKNLERYEERFGTIDISSDDDPVFH